MTTPIERAFTEHRRLLWGLSYRMLGVQAEADEVVQDVFERALRHPPALDRPLRPWLVRVAMNAARDRLRKRRRTPYPGPWLPPPAEEPAAPVPGERLQQVSYALLVALEQLTPRQRAVWLLREVLGMSTAEAAGALAVQPGSVKVTLHRARKALGDHNEPMSDPVTGMVAVAALAAAILSGDVAGVTQLLSADCVALTDGGGVYHAARVPVVGAWAVARLLVGLARKNPGAVYAPDVVAGCPAVFVTNPGVPVAFAPRSVTLFGVRHGRIERVWSVLAPDKLPP